MSSTPKHTIDICINEFGKVEATVQGVTGTACSDISKFLDALGKVEEDKHTSDYFKKPGQGVTISSGK